VNGKTNHHHEADDEENGESDENEDENELESYELPKKGGRGSKGTKMTNGIHKAVNFHRY
jgi:hypothetical protein